MAEVSPVAEIKDQPCPALCGTVRAFNQAPTAEALRAERYPDI